MKLITIQTKSAYLSLIEKGYLITDENYVNELKYGVPYSFVTSNMNHINNKYNAKFPVWTWVKYGKNLTPPKNKLLGFFADGENEIVRITFNKPDSEVLVSDYIKYHFMLTNEYLPKDFEDKQNFDKLLKKFEVTNEDLLAYVRRDKFKSFRTDENFNLINEKIKNSYKYIFENLGKYRQGTVWFIDKAEIEKVEFINKNSCTKKKSVDYRKLYIKSLKKDNYN